MDVLAVITVGSASLNVIIGFSPDMQQVRAVQGAALPCLWLFLSHPASHNLFGAF